MKILLTCSKTSSPSYIFYKNSFRDLAKQFNKVIFKSEKFTNKLLNENYDIILFMSGTVVKKLKKINGVKFGIVDPRASNYDNFKNFDFILANGLEEKIFFNYTKLPTFIYPVYPKVKCKKKIFNKRKTIISYHGNKEHLVNMYPRVTGAIAKISTTHKVQLNLIYNIKEKGKIKNFNEKNLGFKVLHKQYYNNCFNKYLFDTDIGIIPQIYPEQKRQIKRNIGNFFSKQLFKKKYKFKIEFKETTNLGRHFIFAQMKIPIITDYTISSSNFINHKINGLLGFDSSDWYENFKYFIENKNYSKKIGIKLFRDWKKKFSHKNLNNKLIIFFKRLNEK